MSLADDAAAYPAAGSKEYRPSIEFNGRTATIDTGTIEAEPGQPPEYAELLRQVGRDPARWRLVSIDREKHWQVPYRPIEGYDERGKPIYGELTEKWLASYAMRCELIDGGAPADLDALILAAKSRRDDASRGGPYWFVFQAGDLQLGKISRDGSTPEIVERFAQSVEAAKAELRAARRFGIGGVQISLPGDCIEGGQSQGGRNMAFMTAQTVPEQARILRRLMLYAIDELADVPHVYLDVVNGNHDENERRWNERPGDGWATETATTVHDALALNPAAYGHVEVRVPEVWSGHMTVPVGDTTVTVVHGHQWRQRQKAMDWLAKQAVHKQPPGAADLVQHGHYHTLLIEQHKTRTIIGSPTFDCGSDYYRERHGAESRRGAVVYLLRGGEFSRLAVV
ncbi:MRE11 double-strand break endo/exonuclease [Mycobacterium phage Malthus]|uniref:MRE11 double-strand break endo/exonuclease n=1 Tax=Mycobacterium phage Malthus TaxID=2592661 RepID=A0A5Q2WRR1_9CAUD|nr:MRE11 double-strand break endo/exonuclease [Mycobacterium phage Malthus]WRQ08331.1 MRE11 double-strand break endo/exonuclease [Mycobacterium phage june]